MPSQLQCHECGATFDAGSPESGWNGHCPQCGEVISPPQDGVLPTSNARSEAAVPAASDTMPIQTAADEPVLATPATDTSTAPPEVAIPPKPPDDPFSQFAVYDGATELVYDTAAGAGEAAESRERVDPDRLALPRSILYLQGGLLVLVALASFGLGVLFGTIAGKRTEPQARVARPCVVSGIVATRDSRGRDEPDDGAVVMIVPQNARPDERVNVEGLRPGDPLPDRDHPSLRAITQLGGDYARTDLDGQFRVRVPDAGDYYLLVVSHRATRSANEPLNRTHVAQIGGYVLPAAQLVGDQRYRWLTERIDGDKTMNIVLE